MHAERLVGPLASALLAALPAAAGRAAEMGTVGRYHVLEVALAGPEAVRKRVDLRCCSKTSGPLTSFWNALASRRHEQGGEDSRRNLQNVLTVSSAKKMAGEF